MSDEKEPQSAEFDDTKTGIKRLWSESEDKHSLKVKKLSVNATLPVRGSKGAAGYDLASAEDCVLSAKGKALIKTDLSIAVPEGYYGRIGKKKRENKISSYQKKAPRSSLAWKNHIDVGAGVLDEDYRGPVGVVLFNHSDIDFKGRKKKRNWKMKMTCVF